MKILSKVMLVLMIACTLLPISAIAAPDDNQILFWIGTQDVVTKKRTLLANKHEKLKPSNIKDLKLIKSQQKNEVITMKETAKYTFTYFYEKDLPCDANITYSWTRFQSDYQLQSIIVDCQVE